MMVSFVKNNTSPASTFFPVMAASYEGSRSHSFRHTALDGTLLEEWSTRRRNLYLKTHNTHEGQTSIPLAVFEPTIPPSERPQTNALDRAATGIDI